MTPAAPPAEAFFLPAADGGERFCVYHPPAGAWRGALVYLHPFAEEMNLARRIAALAARALAARGTAVLQIDLHGCGDSSGDFSEARWEGWLADTAAACAWLGQRSPLPVGLWGLRLGALLALDHARRAEDPTGPLLLWQPQLAGSAALTQFLRLRVAHDMLADAGAAGATTGALRAALLGGEALEVAGYRIDSALATAIDGLDAAQWTPAAPVHWIDTVAASDRPVSPAAMRTAERWRAGGATVRLEAVAGPAFWSSAAQDFPALIEASCAQLAGGAHGA